MKILISSDGLHAHYYQRLAWLRAFRSVGIDAIFWDCKNTPAFDAFDKFEPDMFLGQLYNLNESLMKCIYERPHLKVGLRAGDWGSHGEEVDRTKFNILFSSPQDMDLLKKLKEETGKPDFVHIHYDDEAISRTHDGFDSLGIPQISLMMCADVEGYVNAQEKEQLKCDLGFVGGYWPYKAQVIDRYLLPLCHPVGKYNIKIFGNQPWNCANQYCGLIGDEEVKNLFKSAKICPNLSEPHAQEYGFDINERIFKVLCAGGFCISDSVTSLEKIFNEKGVVFADSPQDFSEKVEYYLKHDEERIEIAKTGKQNVLSNHTNFHRISQILQGFGYEQESKNILNGWSENMEQYLDV